MIYSESENFILYEAKRLRTESPVAKIRYRCYKNKLVECLFRE